MPNIICPSVSIYIYIALKGADPKFKSCMHEVKNNIGQLKPKAISLANLSSSNTYVVHTYLVCSPHTCANIFKPFLGLSVRACVCTPVSVAYHSRPALSFFLSVLLVVNSLLWTGELRAGLNGSAS